MLSDYQDIIKQIDQQEDATVGKLKKVHLNAVQKILMALSLIYVKGGKEKLSYADVAKSREVTNLYALVANESSKLGKSVTKEINDLLDTGSKMSYDWMHEAVAKDVQKAMKGKTPHLPEMLETTRKGLLNSPKKDAAINRTQESFEHDIVSAVQRSFIDNKGYTGAAKQIQARTQVSYNRSKLIARTEMHRVRETTWITHAKQLSTAGVPMTKTWRNAGDDRVRHSNNADHVVMEDQTRKVEQNFDVNSYPAPAPGMTGIPDEDCNCRCIAIYSVDDGGW